MTRTPDQRRYRSRAVIVLTIVLLLFSPQRGLALPPAIAAEHPLAVEAGMQILDRGGNAVDAAVATALAVCVVNPSSCGIGGGGFAMVYDRRRGRIYALDYREQAPAAARREMFVRNGKPAPELSRRGGLAVAVPGELAGLSLLQRRFGKLAFADVIAPAVALARRGFHIEAHLAGVLERLADEIRGRPPLAAIYLRPDGTPLRAGDLLVQDDLGRTLATIAADGAEAFYRGPLAQAIVISVQRAGGVMTAEDLAAYMPVWRLPLTASFGPWDVYGMPPPSSGGVTLLEIVGILQAGALPSDAFDRLPFLHLFIEASQFAFADRARFLGDPDFVRVPVRTLLAPARLQGLRSRIVPDRTFPPDFYGLGISLSDQGTSHLSVVDAHGNAVAMTTSINTAFGSLVVVEGTGIVLNNTMDDFSAQPGTPNVYGLVGSEANAVAPGKRPLSSMAPTIVLRDAQPVLVVGASGGPFIISATAQVLLRALHFGQSLDSAVEAPRVHHQWLPAILMVEPGVGEPLRAALTQRGHQIREVPVLGAVQAVRVGKDGSVEAVGDPRKGGAAAVGGSPRHGRRVVEGRR